MARKKLSVFWLTREYGGHRSIWSDLAHLWTSGHLHHHCIPPPSPQRLFPFFEKNDSSSILPGHKGICHLEYDWLDQGRIPGPEEFLDSHCVTTPRINENHVFFILSFCLCTNVRVQWLTHRFCHCREGFFSFRMCVNNIDAKHLTYELSVTLP